ncbi:MAG: hypothetical protein K2I20_02565 [Clostridia bacterium]|nr:hypothetical protein [Clostridia bacterium]
MNEKENNDKKDELKKVNSLPASAATGYFWGGAAASAVGLALFVLTLCLPNIFGVYGLIAAVLCALASLAFLATQKKKNNFKAVLYVTVAAYILLAVFVGFFIGGIIYASVGG